MILAGNSDGGAPMRGGAGERGSERYTPLTWQEELGLRPWDVLVLAATVVVAVTTPLEAVFEYASSAWWVAFSLVVSAVLAYDVVQRFSRPVRVDDRLITDRNEIRRRYLRTWFAVDALAAVPFGVVAAAPGISGSTVASVLRVLALLRVLRIARALMLQREWRLRTSLNPAMLRLSFFVFWIGMLSHWIACGWIALDGELQGHLELHPYQQALYWTITTLTTVGYGDLTPNGSTQVGYTMLVMALGAAMYGYAIGNVANLLTNLDLLRSQHLGRIERINTFLRDRQVPRELQARVRDYYNYVWESRMGNQSELLDDLPESLHTEISLHLNRHILQKVPLFEGADEAFLRDLALHLEPMVAIPGDAIVQRGDIGDSMFFINKGTVQVMAYDEKEVIATLHDGNFFGEFALLTSQPRANSVVAVDYCNLYTIDRESFDRVLQDFPEFAAGVRRIAASRQAEVRPDDA